MSINESNLLNNVLNVFIEKGFTATTTRELADRAGIAEITLFRKYGSKKAIFSTAVLNYLHTHALTDFDFSKDASFEQSLIRLLTQRYSFVAQNHAVMRMLIAETLLRIWPEEFNILHQMQLKNRQVIEACASHHGITIDSMNVSIMMNGYIMSDIIQSQHDTTTWKMTEETHRRIASYVRRIVTSVN